MIVDGDNKGLNNENLDAAIERVEKSKMYEDLSTVIICPTRGMFPTRVVQSWMKLIKPTNQIVHGPIFAESMKVDAAYNALIKYVLDHKILSKCKYILTIEEDNLPPADGLVKLYENTDKYDVIGGLYWSKGNNGFPMIFGDPSITTEIDMKPMKPIPDTVQECNGTGMGFTLFKTDIFRNMPEPWFKTLEATNIEGDPLHLTQDLFFAHNAKAYGYKLAVDNRVLVGHLDAKEDKVW
jgi:hypothetical protein